MRHTMLISIFCGLLTPGTMELRAQPKGERATIKGC